MKFLNKRLLFYLIVFIVMGVAIQWRKAQVLEERARPEITIPREIELHGYPVDVEVVKAADIFDSLRVTAIHERGARNVVHFWLSRDQREKVKPGQVVYGLEDEDPIGKVSFVSSTPSLQNGLYKGAIQLNKPLSISGQTIQAVDIVTHVLKNALSVPVEALDNTISEQGSNYVWVDKDGKGYPVQVKLGVIGRGRIEIVKGLSSGERVVVNGQKALEEGARLRIREVIE